MEEGKISFTKDIIKQVSKELSIDEGKIWGVYNTMMLYLDYLVNKTSAVAVFIPHLGTLHVKVGYVLNKLDTLRGKKETDEEAIEIYEGKKEKLDNHIQKMLTEDHRKKSRHLQRSRIAMESYNCGKSMREIEEIQNSR